MSVGLLSGCGAAPKTINANIDGSKKTSKEEVLKEIMEDEENEVDIDTYLMFYPISSGSASSGITSSGGSTSTGKSSSVSSGFGEQSSSISGTTSGKSSS